MKRRVGDWVVAVRNLENRYPPHIVQGGSPTSELVGHSDPGDGPTLPAPSPCTSPSVRQLP